MNKSSPDNSVVPHGELRRRRWLKRVEKLVPEMIDLAEKEGGLVVAELGRKRLSDTQEIRFTLEARLVDTEFGGAHKLR